MKVLSFTTLVLAIGATPALAQDASHGAAIDLPAICLVNAGTPQHSMAMDMGAVTGPNDVAHPELMAGMDRMMGDMDAGATATDIDVAFTCSMIPHHRGAIDMAKAELAQGDDPWVRSLAEQVVAAQEQEIADMLAWLAKQPL